MKAKSQVHRERVLEQRQIAANQLRNRIPTEALHQLEQTSNGHLRLILDGVVEGFGLEACAAWELEYREAYGITYSYEKGGSILRRRAEG